MVWCGVVCLFGTTLACVCAHSTMHSFSWALSDFLALLKNDITGTIPTEFGQLTNMTRLDMQEMHLDGTLPSELGTMTLLSKFMM